MPFARTINNSILDHFTTKTTWAARTLNATWVGFSTTTPTTTGTNVTEPNTGAYARQQITAAQWSAAVNSAVANNTEKTFPTAIADWSAGVNFTHMVLYDALTLGVFLGFAPITTPRAVLNADTAKILIDELDLVIGE